MTDIEKIATHYKLDHQLLKLVEEMAELTKDGQMNIADCTEVLP